jgi:hypothetical protein
MPLSKPPSFFNNQEINHDHGKTFIETNPSIK